jgi:hypothetical protein
MSEMVKSKCGKYSVRKTTVRIYDELTGLYSHGIAVKSVKDTDVKVLGQYHALMNVLKEKDVQTAREIYFEWFKGLNARRMGFIDRYEAVKKAEEVI